MKLYRDCDGTTLPVTAQNIEVWEDGVNIQNIQEILNDINPCGVDLSSGVEKELGIKDNDIINNFIEKINNA